MQVGFPAADRRLELAIAIVGLDPDEIARRAGVRFASGEDDLDSFRAAVIQAPDGKQFALLRHDNSKERGTSLLTTMDSEDLAGDLDRALSLLELPRSLVTWRHPRARR